MKSKNYGVKPGSSTPADFLSAAYAAMLAERPVARCSNASFRVFEQTTDDGKRFATLRAHLALKGYSLHRTAADDGPVCFYVTRWGMARELRELAAVAQFLDQVGGAHA